MEWTGESFAVFLWLAGLAIGAGMTAIPVPPGRARVGLLTMAAIFALATAAWVLRPAGVSAQAVWRLLVALTPLLCGLSAGAIVWGVRSGALVGPPDAQASKGKLAASKNPAEATESSPWQPDVPLWEAIQYIIEESRWPTRELNLSEFKSVLRGALHQGEVTAWGREHPDTREFQISRAAWAGAEINIPENYAFLKARSMAVHSVRLAWGQVKATWPSK